MHFILGCGHLGSQKQDRYCFGVSTREYAPMVDTICRLLSWFYCNCASEGALACVSNAASTLIVIVFNARLQKSSPLSQMQPRVFCPRCYIGCANLSACWMGRSKPTEVDVSFG